MAERGPQLGRPLVDTVGRSQHRLMKELQPGSRRYTKNIPVDRMVVEGRKKRMLDEVRAYRLRELREASELPQVHTLRKYIEAIGGTLRIEVELGDERIQIA